MRAVRGTGMGVAPPPFTMGIRPGVLTALGLLTLAAVAGASQLGCYGSCNSYAPPPYLGSAEYDGQTVSPDGATAPVTGAVPMMLTTRGFTQHFEEGNCTYDGVDFTVLLGGDSCELAVDVTSSTDSKGGGNTSSFTQAVAEVVGGQTCTVILANGAATLTIQSGTVTVTPSSLSVQIAGSFSTVSDGGTASGYLSLSAT
jgi:hypothetical protein